MGKSMTWCNDMSKAPKSSHVGSRVQGIYLELYCPDFVSKLSDPLCGVCIGWWEPLVGGGCWMGEGGFTLHPTHWRHLRPAPEDGERRGGE